MEEHNQYSFKNDPSQPMHSAEQPNPMQPTHSTVQPTQPQPMHSAEQPNPVQPMHSTVQPTQPQPINSAEQPNSVQPMHSTEQPNPMQSTERVGQPNPVQPMHSAEQPNPMQPTERVGQPVERMPQIPNGTAQPMDTFAQQPQEEIVAIAATTYDLKLYKVAVARMNIFIYISFGLAILLFAISVTIGVITNRVPDLFSWFIAVFLLLGVVYTVLKFFIAKEYKKGMVNYFVFYQNYFMLKVVRDGIITDTKRILFSDMTSKKIVGAKDGSKYLRLMQGSWFVKVCVYVDIASIPQDKKQNLEQILRMQLTK